MMLLIFDIGAEMVAINLVILLTNESGPIF